MPSPAQRWWGLGAAAILDVLLGAYLGMRLYSDLREAAPENHAYLKVVVAVTIGIGVLTLVPFLSGRLLKGAWPLVTAVALGWPFVGFLVSALLGV
ncbi:hypothetical protein [Actinoplanes sp. NPDC051494]|uniref:hypothetical protein n=1 Tax=Actinoplanes sp. NPDC051494 TaxID=3363907 RepID=UPI00379A751A